MERPLRFVSYRSRSDCTKVRNESETEVWNKVTQLPPWPITVRSWLHPRASACGRQRTFQPLGINGAIDRTSAVQPRRTLIFHLTRCAPPHFTGSPPTSPTSSPTQALRRSDSMAIYTFDTSRHKARRPRHQPHLSALPLATADSATLKSRAPFIRETGSPPSSSPQHQKEASSSEPLWPLGTGTDTENT